MCVHTEFKGEKKKKQRKWNSESHSNDEVVTVKEANEYGLIINCSGIT